ncbi:GAF domain-containing protein [Streptomyces sp. 142MFCol3.1]|uniref:sensor histidine kinase n=1 Tax=Streptomyces sp. 142MFCol3.1 TaxID=1172179 RepID=UPI0004291E1E|nr:GAF domain-containing protein [Streptomyces sp. 142MFCol3.1]
MASPTEPRIQLPQLKLDELLEELQARLDVARGTRDRVYGLMTAVLSVGRELELEHVLQSIVESAAALVKAEFAALGVLGPDGRTPCAYHIVGVRQEDVDGAGRCGEKHAGVGDLDRRPESPCPEKTSHRPASYGLPPGERPVKDVLTVPIRVRDENFGDLYLADKHGGVLFDEEDEALLSTLAVAAGVAIDNARLYEDSRLRERWLLANAEIAHSLMSGNGRTDVLNLIAEHARGITGSALAAVATPMEDTHSLTVEIAMGVDAEAHRGLVLSVQESLVGLAFTAVAPVTSDDVQHDERISPQPPRFGGLGPAVAAPIGTGGADVRGVVLLARNSGRPVFSGKETEMLQNFAAQAAIALELAERRRDTEQIAVLQDRERIARDLHHVAIQRLFEAGMTLQSVGRLVDHPEAAERILRAVDELDETIKIIRSAIFGLRERDAAGSGLRARVVGVVDEMAPVLNFGPSLRMEGRIDTDVSCEIADHVVAVLSEALTNVARHAHADRADVVLGTDDDEVFLSISDNGVGIPPDGRRSGLRNLSERAQELGGALDISDFDGAGTELRWHVPLGSPRGRERSTRSTDQREV